MHETVYLSILDILHVDTLHTRRYESRTVNNWRARSNTC